MRPSRIASVTALLVAALSAPATAATLSPVKQVQQVVDWFTGFFDNRAQVSRNANVPFLEMENCAVSANGSANSQYVHLEQFFGSSGRLLRSSAYEFSPAATGVDLSVFSYRDRAAALGTCDQAMPSLDLSNLAMPSCDIMLAYKPEAFFGTNEPDGCPTSFPIPGSTVVSTVTISADAVDSLDVFRLPTGGEIGTPIAFRRVSTPEPAMLAALAGLGLAAIASRRKK
ncbi:MAG: PEP-CTERM sorting domain-containing protein [Leptolyngbya sp. SIO4C1]|nr:PEP-CTERM sorting domain-containing protein [Leptolyngbya sp. SIO4C1]